MTIHLPEDLERSMRAEVHSGHFASVDDLVAQAVRSLLRQPKAPPPGMASGPAGATWDVPDPLIGSMSDHAELMDQIVEDAMRHREQQPRRLTAGE
jgi:serine/threonine protein kinase HipA of HipAB toxin-antitoxin module